MQCTMIIATPQFSFPTLPQKSHFTPSPTTCLHSVSIYLSLLKPLSSINTAHRLTIVLGHREPPGGHIPKGKVQSPSTARNQPPTVVKQGMNLGSHAPLHNGIRE